VSGRYAFYLETVSSIPYNGNAIDASYSYGYLNAVDVLYPTSPNILWTSSSFTNPHALAVAGNMVFVSADKLYIYNFSIPTVPVLSNYIYLTYSGEITAKMIDANNYILLVATKSYLYSYKVYRSGSSVYYNSVSNIYNNARDAFLSGNYVYVVANYNVFQYTLDSYGYLLNYYTRNYAITNSANSIIYDNTTNYGYINYQSSNGISQYDITTNSYCTYTFGYQTDIISISDHYFFATQSGNKAFLVIDRNRLSCNYNNNYNNSNNIATGAIIGITFAVIFVIFFMACIIALSVRRHRRLNVFSYRPLVNQTTTTVLPQPYFTQPVVYPIQPIYSPQVYPMQPPVPYPQGNPPPYNPEVVPPGFTPPEYEQKK